MSLCWPGIRDNMLGGKPAGEEAIEASAPDETGTRESCEINVFSPGTAGAEGAWLARVRVSVRVVGGTVVDARGGGNNARGW